MYHKEVWDKALAELITPRLAAIAISGAEVVQVVDSDEAPDESTRREQSDLVWLVTDVADTEPGDLLWYNPNSHEDWSKVDMVAGDADGPYIHLLETYIRDKPKAGGQLVLGDY